MKANSRYHLLILGCMIIYFPAIFSQIKTFSGNFHQQKSWSSQKFPGMSANHKDEIKTVKLHVRKGYMLGESTQLRKTQAKPGGNTGWISINPSGALSLLIVCHLKQCSLWRT